jgi:hypothetical protein
MPTHFNADHRKMFLEGKNISVQSDNSLAIGDAK